jgi:peptidoglycan hydrolase-like protein with peptidoglycan-binding domain
LTAYALCPGTKVDKADLLERVASARRLTGADHQTSGTDLSDVPSSSTSDQFDPVIKLIQSELKILGPFPTLQIDGVFGAETRSALISFQQKHGLADDWEPGSRTRALLSTLASHAS